MIIEEKTGYKSAGVVPRAAWVALVEVRKKGSQGNFFIEAFWTLADEPDVNRYILEDLDMYGFEPRAILWKRKCHAA